MSTKIRSAKIKMVDAPSDFIEEARRLQKQENLFTEFLIDAIGEPIYMSIDRCEEILYIPNKESLSRWFPNRKLSDNDVLEIQKMAKVILSLPNNQTTKCAGALFDPNWRGGLVSGGGNENALIKACVKLQNGSITKTAAKKAVIFSKKKVKVSRLKNADLSVEQIEDIIESFVAGDIDIDGVRQICFDHDKMWPHILPLRQRGLLPICLGFEFKSRNHFLHVYRYGRTKVDKYLKSDKKASLIRKEKQARRDELSEKGDHKNDLPLYVEMIEEGLKLDDNFNVTHSCVSDLSNENKKYPAVVILRTLLETEKYKRLKDSLKPLSELYELELWLANPRNGRANIALFKDRWGDILYFQSQLMPFNIWTQDNNPYVDLHLHDTCSSIRGLPSGYVDQMRVSPATQKGHWDASYIHGNRHRQAIDAKLKSVGAHYKKGTLWLYLPLEIETPEVDKLVRKAFEALQYSRKTALKATLPIGTRVMGIDLNIHPAFAFAIFEITKDEGILLENGLRAKLISVSSMGAIADQKLMTSINKLVEVINATRFVIKYIKGYKDNKHVYMKDYIPTALANSGLCSLTGDFREDREKVSLLMRDIKRKFQQLKLEKRTNDLLLKHIFPPAEAFEYYCLLDSYIPLVTAFNHMTMKERDDSCASGLKESRTRLRDDLRKKLISGIEHVAISNGVHIVIGEDFNYRQDKLLKRHENRLWRRLSAKTTISFLKERLLDSGILFDTVDPRYTSQSCANGLALRKHSKYYPDIPKENLYVPVNGDVYVVDSDLQAAYNIAAQFLTRYEEPCHLRCKVLGDNRFLVINDNKSKRLAAFLGSNFAIATLEDGQLEFEKVSSRKKYDSLGKDKETTSLCRSDGQWMTGDKYYSWKTETYRAIIGGEIQPEEIANKVLTHNDLHQMYIESDA